MPLTPEEIASRQFAFAFRGLDKDEVISFLHHVADEYRLVLEALAEAETAAAEARTGADAARSKAREIEQELASQRLGQSDAREHLRATEEARAMEAALREAEGDDAVAEQPHADDGGELRLAEVENDRGHVLEHRAADHGLTLNAENVVAQGVNARRVIPAAACHESPIHAIEQERHRQD